MAKKKTTKTTKTTKSNPVTDKSNPVRIPPRIAPEPRTTPRFDGSLPPSPADVVSEPVASVTATPKAEDVPVKDYVHMQERLAEFKKKHPNGVYFHADAAARTETERALRSLDAKTPVLITSKKTFTAAELKRMGFEVFQNGKDGKLVGTRVK